MKEPYFIENLIKEKVDSERTKFKGSKKEFEKKIEKKLPEIVEAVSNAFVENIYNYCLGENDTTLREKEILERIQEKYSTGIKLLTAFIELSSKIGSITYEKYHKIFDSIEEHVKLDTLIANQVRACQIANEIKTLVANGYADGAFARWRTLHEVCTVFLYLYDSTHETIEMYNDFGIIEKFKKGKQFNECCDQLGWKPIPEEELDSLSAEVKMLKEKYGKEFVKDYGWTMNDLPYGKRNFKELENHVEIGYLRPLYTWSNESIHAGVSGITYKLSLRNEEQNKFLTGPNDCGFLDPVQLTCHSLFEMSFALLNMEESLMNRILEEMLVYFKEEIVNEFDKKK